MARLAQEVEDDISIPELIPSLTPTMQQYPAFIILPDNATDYEYGYYVQHSQHYDGEEVVGTNSSVEAPKSEGFDGETVASTGNSLTSVCVWRLSGYSAIQVEGSILDIPFQEQDDPPDLRDWDAASPEYVKSQSPPKGGDRVLLSL